MIMSSTAPPVSPFPPFSSAKPTENSGESRERRVQLERLKDLQAKQSTQALLNRASKSTSNGHGLPRKPVVAGAAPPVARKLDVSFASKKAKAPPVPPQRRRAPPPRPKSAPPSRRPPPGPPPSKRAPLPQTNKATTVTDRSRVSRPAPVLPQAINGDTTPPITNRTSVKIAEAAPQIPSSTSPMPVKGVSAPPAVEKRVVLPVETADISESSNHSQFTPKVATTSTAGATPHPSKMMDPTNITAGATPHPSKRSDPTNSTAGATPHPSKMMNATETPPPIHNMNAITSPYMNGHANGQNTRFAGMTPYPNGDESPELRQQKQLLVAERERKAALDQISSLEEKIRNLQSQDSSSMEALEAVLQVADTQGDAAALEFVRSKAAGRAVQFSLPQEPSVVVASPVPKRIPVKQDSLEQFLKPAVETLPFEYESDSPSGRRMTVTIRRPYDCANEQKLWFEFGELPTKKYALVATAHSPDSLEALVTYDGTEGEEVVVHGVAECRRRNPVNGRWVRGKENEPREALQNALAAREHYCQAAIATADALRVQSTKAKPAVASVPPSNAPQKPIDKKSPEKKKTKEPELPPDDGISLFSALMGLFAWVAKSILLFPVRVVVAFIVQLLAVTLLSIFYMYVASGYNAGPMSAASELLHNRPGIL